MHKYRVKNHNKDKVLAVELTEANAHEVAGWCGGEVIYEDPEIIPSPFAGLALFNAYSDAPQEVAVAGDFVVKDPLGYCVFPPKVFKQFFAPPRDYSTNKRGR